MPNNRPDLPDDTPARTVRGQFDQPFKPSPDKIFTTDGIAAKTTGYAPVWPTPPHQRLEGSVTIGQVYGDAGDPLHPFVWVGVGSAAWIEGLEDLTQSELDAFDSVPVDTDEAIDGASFSGYRLRLSFDADDATGDIWRTMRANDRLYSLPTNGKITPTVPGWSGEFDPVSGMAEDIRFVDVWRTRNNAIMTAYSTTSILLVRDPDNLGKAYVLAGGLSEPKNESGFWLDRGP